MVPVFGWRYCMMITRTGGQIENANEDGDTADAVEEDAVKRLLRVLLWDILRGGIYTQHQFVHFFRKIKNDNSQKKKKWKNY